MTHAVRRWAESTAESGATATVAHDGGAPPTETRDVRWVDLPHIGPRQLRTPRSIGSVLRGTDAIVLHSGWTLGNLWAGAVARSRGVAYVLEPRGAYDPHILRRKRALKRAWCLVGEDRLMRGAAAIQVFFAEERRHLEEMGYRGPILVVPNGVDSPANPPWRGGSGELLWLGRFDPEHKGLDLLVHAVAELAPAERLRIRLHGPDRRGGRGRVAGMIRRAGLEPWITVGPPVYGQAKRDLLVRCDGFLYPSRWDACPNAVLESAALGVPTLCGPFPLGARLAEAGGGIQAEAQPASIADALKRFGDRRKMEALGTAGARLMRERFAWSYVAREWVRQLSDVLAELREESRRTRASRCSEGQP